MGWADLARAGYSPDEEFTMFAVRGIAAGGLPLLPSGLLYDRGLLYSYASWLAGGLTADPLVAYRLVSFAGAVAGLALVAREAARLAGPFAAALAALLVAGSIPFWVTASTARFYGPLLACYAGAVVLLARPVRGAPGWALLAASAALARWCHELAFTLALVPAAAAFVAPAGQRRPWIAKAMVVGAALVAAQGVLLYVNQLAPSSGDTMVRRFFLWQALNLFERPAPGLGIPGVVAVLVALVRPDRAAVAVRWAAMVTAMGAAFVGASALAGGATLTQAGTRIVGQAAAYPLDLFAYLARTSPLLVLAALGAFGLRAAGAGGVWTPRERGVHALWLGWVLWFGVIESGVTARYLLLPVTFMLAATAVDLAVLARARHPRRWPGVAAAVLAAAIVVESWYGPAMPRGPSRLAEARPTLVPEAVRDAVRHDDLVACTDELGCLLAAGRIDAWLVLDDFFRERFIVMRGTRPLGVYTGAPAVDEIAPLVQQAGRERRRLVIVDVLKEVPGFGPNVALVSRQLAREGLDGRVLAASGGIRVVEVMPSEGLARAGQPVSEPGAWSMKPRR
ncbi:MAG: hypothetical protein AB1635_18675 [Acidobacteriota bacterium]